MEDDVKINENDNTSPQERCEKQQSSNKLLSAKNIILLGMAALSMSSFFLKNGTAANFLGASNCNIKGNISRQWHRKVYYVPSNRHYSRIKISPQWGERWFCSPKEARDAGWRKARW